MIALSATDLALAATLVALDAAVSVGLNSTSIDSCYGRRPEWWFN